MSSLVFSNFYPAKITESDINKVLLDLIKQSSRIIIASGYISNDAMVEINKIVENNTDKIKELSIFIGMHYIEGFTKQQYYSCVKLNELLISKNIGGIYVSPTMKFHGKIYSFVSEEGIHTSLIGSANLSSFIQNLERTYETMLIAKDDELAKDIYDKNQKIFDKLGVRIDRAEAIQEEDFIKSRIDLSSFDNVSKIDQTEISKILDQDSEYCFKVEVKTEEKSNLNAFFGKGRVNTRGFEVPRPWYEVEIVVSNRVTTLPGYPKDKTFKVVTMDGWVFECKTQGDYSKNLRSTVSLSILGKWLKGHLEISGCLKTGEMVTDQVLNDYGRNHLTLRSTSQTDLWIMEF